MNQSKIIHREYREDGTLSYFLRADGSGQWYWEDGRTLRDVLQADGTREGYRPNGTIFVIQHPDGSMEWCWED